MCVYGVFITVHFVKIKFLNELLDLPLNLSRPKGKKRKVPQPCRPG